MTARTNQGAISSSGRIRLQWPPGPDRHRRPRLYRASWVLARWAFAGYFGRREAGAENVPASGPVILAANHASFMDPPLIGSSCPRPISYLARESLFRQSAFAWILRGLGSVPVDRDGASGKGLKTILERLLDGDGIILFPEGTRTADGQLQPGRSGVGLIVLKSRAPVVPVRVFGTFEAFGRHHGWPRPRPIGVRFGEALRFDREIAEAESAPRPRVKELYQQVTDRILGAIGRLPAP